MVLFGIYLSFAQRFSCRKGAFSIKSDYYLFIEKSTQMLLKKKMVILWFILYINYCVQFIHQILLNIIL